MTKKFVEAPDQGLSATLRPLVLAIYVAEKGIPRQRWAFVSLAEEILRASRPSGPIHKCLAAARDPKRGFIEDAVFNSVLDLVAVGLLDAIGAGGSARLRVSAIHHPALWACWRSISSSDRKAIELAIQRLEASSVALSKMRRASGDVSVGTLAATPALRHVSLERVRAANS